MTRLAPGLIWPSYAWAERQADNPLEDVELVCPNDRCFGYDVDQPPDSLPQVQRKTWLADEDGERCPLCGTRGEPV